MAARWHVDTGLVLLASGALGALIDGRRRACRRCAPRGLAFAVITLAFGARDLRLPAEHRLLAASSAGCPTARSTARACSASSRSRPTREFYFLSRRRARARASSAVRGLRASRTGRVLIGVRDNERAAEAYSIRARTRSCSRSRSPASSPASPARCSCSNSSCSSSQTFTPDVEPADLRDGRGRRAGLDLGRGARRGVRVRRAVLPARGVRVPRDRRRPAARAAAHARRSRRDVRRRARRRAALVRRAARASACRAWSPTRSCEPPIRVGRTCIERASADAATRGELEASRWRSTNDACLTRQAAARSGSPFAASRSTSRASRGGSSRR